MTKNTHNPKNTEKRTRFAIYTRYSSEMQNDLSLEAQEYRCRQAIGDRGGVIVAAYSDGAKSGWSLERDGFNELRHAAEHGKFDAVMFWKFDRLARNHDHAVMIKMLLRHEYGLKLYCVEGFSEDENDSPYSAMMEQMLAVFSAFYSRNLSNETKRGKFQRAMLGEYNGSVAPLGYDLVTIEEATRTNRRAGLYLNPRLAVIVRRAFRLYATGKYSDVTLAAWMNRQRVIQKLRQGQQPINKEMVRDMLQNRLYTGLVSYSETHYSGSFGQGKQSSRGRKQWFEGKHQGFITNELFERCQEVRREMSHTFKAPATIRTYILHDRVYCLRCLSMKPEGLVDDNYGKMRPSYDNRREQAWYRCQSRTRGYHNCTQGYADENKLNDQVVQALATLEIPTGFKDRVEAAVQAKVEHAEALRRMAELEEVVKRVDFSWEQGFLTPEEYKNKRGQLQREMEALRPVDYDDLMVAEDLLRNFKTYWDACEKVNKPEEARKQLLAKIVDRVFVYDHQVVGVTLHGNYSLILDTAHMTSPELVNTLREQTKKAVDGMSTTYSQDGSDGFPMLSRQNIFVWAPRSEPHHIIIRLVLRVVRYAAI